MWLQRWKHQLRLGPYVLKTKLLEKAYQTYGTTQVAAKDLPQLLKELQPLIPTASAEPVHTEDFEDGRRIPSLKELLIEARAPHCKHLQSLFPSASCRNFAAG